MPSDILPSISPSILPSLSLHIPLTAGVLMIIFAIVVLLWAIHMVVMRYHWKNYGNDALILLQMNMLYFIGSAILLGLLFFSMTLYASSLPA
jgi:hypothetical protein